MKATPILRTKNLVKAYSHKRVVNNVNIEVYRGEVVGLLGPNGAGKTTTFYMTTGFVRPDKGNIYLGKRNITNLSMHKRAILGLGYLPQQPSVFQKLTVEDNLMAILELQNLTMKQRNKKKDMLLEDLHITKLAKKQAWMLSGGERRRLEIARSLVTSPSIILFDEPFSGVDPIAVAEVQSIIQKLKKKKIGILLTDHNVREILSTTDRSYLIYEGRILKSGTSDFLANDDEAKKIYLGEKFSM
ncbi:MAG: LPS export ABC transporter ATP-binding protein [Candidatus Aureabacteria bacterium]|nr:LPS export ABC transporter ATP-binding protein [Candidatus Auribacterota bacterium]